MRLFRSRRKLEWALYRSGPWGIRLVAAARFRGRYSTGRRLLLRRDWAAYEAGFARGRSADRG